MKTSEEIDKPLKGKPLTPDDEFYLSWGRESLKANLSTANNVLSQLISLNTALLGGSFVFLDEKIVDNSFKVGLIVLFAISLITAFLGLSPYEGKISLNSPEDIRHHKETALTSKLRYLWISAILMLAGFAVALAGVVTR